MGKDNESLDFFVRWKNFKVEDNTWENFEFFAHDAPELAQKYLAKIFNAFNVPKTCKSIDKLVKD